MANLQWKLLMRWLLNLPALNNDDRHSTKQENIRTELEVCIHTGTGHEHTQTWGVMHREMKYSAGFWWRVLNQSQCCHSNLKASTCSSSPLAYSHTSIPPSLEQLSLHVSMQHNVILQMLKFQLSSHWEHWKILNI